MQSLQDHNQTPTSSQNQNSLEKPLFSPFLVDPLKLQSGSGFAYPSICYNQKENLIIACIYHGTMQFYDATTFQPFEKEILGFYDPVIQISFQPETDTYLLGCTTCWIYEYNVCKNKLEKLKKCESQVQGVVFLNSVFYAFILLSSYKISIGNLDDDNDVSFDLKDEANTLCHLSKRNLLFVGLCDGSVKIYQTNKLPHLKSFSSIQAHQAENWVESIHCININGKDYVVTASEDWTVKIWHLVKGRMRLLKVIHTESVPHSLVYLENYKMIVIAEESSYIYFLKFPSMKLEKKVDIMEDGVHHLFVMKDKNMIGVTNEIGGFVDFIQLHQKVRG